MNPYQPTNAAQKENARVRLAHRRSRRRDQIVFGCVSAVFLMPATLLCLSLLVIWTHPKGGDNLKSAPVLTVSQRIDRSLLPGALFTGCIVALAAIYRNRPDTIDDDLNESVTSAEHGIHADG